MRAGLPFNRPRTTGRELGYIAQAIDAGHLSGNGAFTARCCRWLEDRTGAQKALLTHSCTGALEMAALLADVGVGDEVIMPSFTFVSTANAFALRGAVPVFVDIRPDTLNLDEALVEEAITPRAKAIVAVHYAGVGCEMDTLASLAAAAGISLIEDAAQGLMASYRGRPLGAFGSMSALSFHETKNVISGEGGALLVNDPALVQRAEIIQEKGTDRSRFHRGEVDKYSWVDLGGSFVPSEINAAFLWAQLENAEELTNDRLALWMTYDELLRESADEGLLRQPMVPDHVEHNAHMYYVLLESEATRTAVIDHLRSLGIGAVFHYVPLHSSVAGLRYGRAHGALPITDDVSARLLRLPLWVGMSPNDVADVVAEVVGVLRRRLEHA